VVFPARAPAPALLATPSPPPAVAPASPVDAIEPKTAKAPTAGGSMAALDQLWDSARYDALVDAIASYIAPLQSANIASLSAAELEPWMAGLYLLQQRMLGVANNQVKADAPEGGRKTLRVLQAVADMQAQVFARAADIFDHQSTTPVVPWTVFKNTMKKPGFH